MKTSGDAHRTHASGWNPTPSCYKELREVRKEGRRGKGFHTRPSNGKARKGFDQGEREERDKRWVGTLSLTSGSSSRITPGQAGRESGREEGVWREV